MTTSNSKHSDHLNEQRPLVSFFVLGYNQEEYTRAAVEGAFSQTYSPLEIILSDDGSSDKTYEIMKEMAAAYDGPHKIILNQNAPNRRLVGNVNELMTLSSAEFVVKNDGDDISTPNRVEKLVACWIASEKKAKLVFSATVSIDEKGIVIGKHQPRGSFPDIMRKEPTPLRIVTDSLHARGAALSWSRELYDKFGPMLETAIADDSILPFRAAVLGEIAYIDEPLVYHRIGGYSWLDKTKNQRQEKMYGRRLKLYESHIESKRAILHDLENINIEEKKIITSFSNNYIKEQIYRIELSKINTISLIKIIPKSLILSIINLRIHYIYLNIKYIIFRPMNGAY